MNNLQIWYTGGLIGTLPTEQHQVSGEFYIVDSRTLFFDNFNYDGGGPGLIIVRECMRVCVCVCVCVRERERGRAFLIPSTIL